MSRHLRRSFHFSRFRMSVRLVAALAVIGFGMISNSASALEWMYVSLGNNTIVRYDVSLTNPAAVASSGNVFVPTGQGLNSPFGLAFDAAGNLYAANLGNNTITRYNGSGTYIGGEPFVPSGQGLNAPKGLAFDTVGNLYAANDFTITRYDSLGARIGTSFVATGQGLIQPVGLTFDTAGNLYAANQSSNTITRYDSLGARIGTDYIPSNAGLVSPAGIAFDKTGNLYAANVGNNTITRYGPSGSFPLGPNLSGPFGLAFDSAGNLYVTNANNNTIFKYNAAGVFQFSWGVPSQPRMLAFVPEPSTYLLGGLATGLMALIARRRKAKRIA